MVVTKGDLVNDTRAGLHPTKGKAGLVLQVDLFDSTAYVAWPASAEPYWAPIEALELYKARAKAATCNSVLAYAADPM